MFIRSRYLMASAAFALILMVASCDRRAPTSPPPAPQPGPPPAPIVGLALVAPSEIAPDETVQLTANATRSDGSVENVSSQAIWRVQAGTPLLLPPPILQLSPSGLATGRNRGEVFLTVNFGGMSANARVLVLPKGTFRLLGKVHEHWVGLENSTVTVMAGVGEGLTAVTNSDGQYGLYGVSGSVRIQAKKDGYIDAGQQLDVTAHRNYYDFAMVANRPKIDFSGTYTFTISTQPMCPPAFPDAARRRTYTASVKHDDQGQLFVSLSGADFIVHDGAWNGFYGRVTSTGEARFYISDPYDYDFHQFDIGERFGDTALLVGGYVTARATPELISGTLAGEILIAQSASPPFESYSSRCLAALFEMVRR